VRRSAYCFVIVSASLLVIAVALQWHLVDSLTPFLMLPVFGLLWLAVVTGLGISVGLIIRDFSRAAFGCFAFCVACSVAAWFDPFTPLWLKAYFSWYEAERNRAVEVLMTDGLPRAPHNSNVVRLPKGWPKLSMGGNELLVEEHDGRTYVLFFTFRGILDNYAGYLFVPEGGDPRRFRDLGEDTTEIVYMRPSWVYVSHH
jgi:hypothetical protein